MKIECCREGFEYIATVLDILVHLEVMLVEFERVFVWNEMGCMGCVYDVVLME